ncbi:sulfotransferase [Nocardioides sp.]|uniref:sulfotransferase family protein n=1 Tax=Nocardioides sp. TaxID=35761 RepID=UPI00271EBB5E|nr:sulfotransferase [Nocardioides sp.]MDO9457239.1 sulfotransferase [Nocardioides sp.]
MPRTPQPDFLIVGAPKAGTTALHTALTQHPDAFLTQPKEPKYWLCDDAPPPHWNGPGDRHSQQEWVWRARAYADLFRGARDDQVRGESTPFYLWSRGAHRRIGEALPDVKLIAVVRDPVDRAYSNWMHLWSDGLEREPDFRRAFEMQDARVEHGYAPFWRYRELGLYGEQLQHLLDHVPREQVLVMRYRALVDEPAVAVDTACRFLGIREGQVASIPRDNARSYAEPGWRTRTLGPVVRAGATLAQFAPPEVWRRAAVPLVTQLSGRDTHRPHLDEAQRAELIQVFADDIALLSDLTGEDFSDWLSPVSRGSFDERAAAGEERARRVASE